MTRKEKLQRLRDDFAYYAANCMSVVSKEGEFVPFVPNFAQNLINEAADEQMEEQGFIRMLLLKARRQGASTNICGRGNHMVQREQSPKTILTLAHNDSTAALLSTMYERFHTSSHPSFSHKQTRSGVQSKGWINGAQAFFRTASNPQALRGGHTDFLHVSEFAQCPNGADLLSTARLQVPDVGRTEIWIESTAFGAADNPFYQMWINCPDGWRKLFIAWFQTPEYRITPPRGFSLSEERDDDRIPHEVEYARLHGLDNGQMAWRRREIQEKNAAGRPGALEFAREFPATAEEAFLTSLTDSYNDAAAVQAAVDNKLLQIHNHLDIPLIVGIDAASGHGASATAVVFRRGPLVYRIERIRNLRVEQQAERIGGWLMRDMPFGIYVDCSEYSGHALVERLIRFPGLHDRVHRVSFGGAAHRPTVYLNARAEMAARCKVWLDRGGVSIPDERTGTGEYTLAMELLMARIKPNEARLAVEPKADIIKRSGASPDGSDAMWLTFRMPDPDYGMSVAPSGTVIRPVATRF